MREIDEVGENYLNHLVARNLIQVARRGFGGRIKSCRIHDILNSLCVRVAKEIKFFNTHNDDDIAIVNSSATRVRRLTTDGRGLREYIYLPSDSKSAKLRTMPCFDGTRHQWKDEDVNFLGGLRFIRVLCLECWYLEISFPIEFGNLNYLNYVRLKVQTGRVKLPSTISNLTSLMTLDPRQCEAELIIPDCILKMKQLRHLLLSGRGVIEYVLGRLQPNVGESKNSIEAFSINLQSLNGVNFFWFPKFTNLRKLRIWFQDDNLSNVKVLLDPAATTTVPNSNKLEIVRLGNHIPCIYPRYNIAELNLCRYENLCRLHLEGVSMVKLPEHDQLPPNFTKLTLVNTCLKEDPMETMKKLPKLKILKSDDFSYVGEKMMVCNGGGRDNFLQLQMLEIFYLPDLRGFIVEEEVMPRLNKFRIKYCASIEVVRIPNRTKKT